MKALSYTELFKGGQRLGRFLWMRNIYSVARNFQQRRKPENIQWPCLLSKPRIAFNTPMSDMLQAIWYEAVSFGLCLSPDLVNQIHQYSRHQDCSEPEYSNPFTISNLDAEGKLPDGHRPLRALVNNPMNCPIVEQLTRDPNLFRLAKDYLGYSPDRISCHLTWSLATQLPLKEAQQKYPPANYHYDIAGYNFATAYFYITPVLNQAAGPHIMFRGSHREKPFWMLLRSGRQTSESLYRYYGQERELMILGGAGFGFFQDPSCFHRVSPPTQSHRLLLQIRYA